MWDRTITDISEEVLKVIRHWLKSCLFFQNECWVKRENEDFKVGKGFLFFHCWGSWSRKSSFVSTETMDSGFKASGLDIDMLRKRWWSSFRSNKLKITSEVKTKGTDFLDVRLNLYSFRPHRKDNTMPLYVNKQSYNPIHIKKEIPGMMGKQILDLLTKCMMRFSWST